MTRLLALALVPFAFQAPAQAGFAGFAGFAMKLPAPMREQLEGPFWRPGCPVPLSDLRLLTVRYVACGISYHADAKPYIDRTPLSKGMVTRGVVRAFKAIGWGWGGDWSGVKDWMHFSSTGH